MTKIEGLVWVALGAVVAGCHVSESSVKEGQSHWLTRCQRASDCGEEQACACGVCTIACEADSSCGGTGSCVRIDSEPSCADAPSAMSDVCLAECRRDRDCGASGLVCSAGSCVAALASDDAGPADAESAPAPVLVNGCEQPGAFDPLEPASDEVCYDLAAHDGAGTAAEPFIVPVDESLSQFYYAIPWPEGSVATRFGGDLDNVDVLRQWLLFSTTSGAPGTVSRNVTGTTLGENARLLAGWGAGGCNVTLPADVAVDLPGPDSGRLLMVQWHHLNLTSEPQPDVSKVQICVVPRSARTHIGAMTVLGTEDLGMPGMAPNEETKLSGSCLNASSDPVSFVAFRPSMHAIGTHMRSEIERANGDVEVVFDAPFSDAFHAYYSMSERAVLQPGDKVRSECTYFNDTSQPVPYGPSVANEVCFQYAYTYPAGALDKTAQVTLLGALNTCWGD